MADLPYGYTVRIQSNGSSDPAASPSNQWQRKLKGQSNYVDLSGETGVNYAVRVSDQGALIRLKQTFNGAPAYSNSLQVTDVPPATWAYGGILVPRKTQFVATYSESGRYLVTVGEKQSSIYSLNGGRSWGNVSHYVDGPQAVNDVGNGAITISGTSANYGTDEKVEWVTDNYQRHWMRGFPTNVNVLGAGMMKDGTLIASHFPGALYVSQGKYEPFVRSSSDVAGVKNIRINSTDVITGDVWGSSAKCLLRFKGSTGSEPIYDKIDLPFDEDVDESRSQFEVSRVAQDGLGNYVVAASYGRIFWSSDGTKWNLVLLRHQLPTGDWIRQSVVYARGKWWAVTNSYGTMLLFSSTNMTDWNPEPLPDGVEGKSWFLWGTTGGDNGNVALWWFSDYNKAEDTHYCILD